MRELNALLRRDPSQLSEGERDRMIQLAETTGVDLSGIFVKRGQITPTVSRSPTEVFGGVATPPPPPEPYSACAADEEFLRARRNRRKMREDPPPPPPPTYEDIVEEDARRRDALSTSLLQAPETFADVRTGRARSVGTQVEMLKEMPKTVYLTPSGTCVHSSRDCSTLSRSTKFTAKEVCSKCIPGQKEVTRPI